MSEYEEININELKDGPATPDPPKPKKKRKTHTSAAVKHRYDKKTYQQIYVIVRKDTDKDILDYLEEMKTEYGYTPTQIFKDLIRKEIEQ